jgi:hypothetical protein
MPLTYLALGFLAIVILGFRQKFRVLTERRRPIHTHRIPGELVLCLVGQQQHWSGRLAIAIAIDRSHAGFILMALTNFSLKNKKPAYQIQLWPVGFVSV